MQIFPQPRMTADEFIAWSIDRPDGRRFELADGEVFEMASEQVRHVLAKGAVFSQLSQAASRAGLEADVFTDGMAVQIGPSTVYEPDAAVRTGARLADDATRYTDPVIVVEVSSPSTQTLDAGAKLADYFTLPSLRHYLILRPIQRTVIHHARLDDGTIRTSFASSGMLTLEPFGMMLEVEAMFGPSGANP